MFNQIKEEKQRTVRQNNSIHLYCKLLAEELNNSGLDMRVVLKPEIAIPWTQKTIKQFLWRSIQIALLQKQSTTELSTAEVSQVYDVLNKHLGEKFGVHVDFPSQESLMEKFNPLQEKSPDIL